MEFKDKIKNIILAHRGSDVSKLKFDILKEIKTEEKRTQPISPECNSQNLENKENE